MNYPNKIINNKIEKLPQAPGVYLFKNTTSKIIYIGKSVRLRDRVKSYFALKNTLEEKTLRLVDEIANLDIIETESEIEALILEAELIKKYQPEYNHRMKDDKRYKYISYFFFYFLFFQSSIYRG